METRRIGIGVVNVVSRDEITAAISAAIVDRLTMFDDDTESFHDTVSAAVHIAIVDAVNNSKTIDAAYDFTTGVLHEMRNTIGRLPVAKIARHIGMRFDQWQTRDFAPRTRRG